MLLALSGIDCKVSSYSDIDGQCAKRIGDAMNEKQYRFAVGRVELGGADS